MKTFAIVVKEYSEGEDYRVSHISPATHLMVYLDGYDSPVLYPLPDMENLEEGQRGPAMKGYLEEILKKGKAESVDVLVTVRKIRVDGPWRENIPYDEDSDAFEIAKDYLTGSEKLENMTKQLYT